VARDVTKKGIVCEEDKGINVEDVLRTVQWPTRGESGRDQDRSSRGAHRLRRPGLLRPSRQPSTYIAKQRNPIGSATK
jgi:hypothetical protein